MKNDITALSYWHPKLEAAGLPVPRTIMLQMPAGAQEDVWKAFDGEEGPGEMKAFCEAVRGAADALGYPCFLRTDHTSGKHEWLDTCFVPDAESIPSHVFAICEFSESAGMFGELPWSNWAVREFLPTKPFGVCSHYRNMPICREFRFFVDGPIVRCRHPYWPLGALLQGGAPSDLDYSALCECPDDHLSALASAVGKVIGGFWSVDLLETERGWFITDMAEGKKSFHWPGCEAP